MVAKALTLIALAFIGPVSGFALGIRIFDHDAFATARGNAFVATADNPSAIYYNPAGITQLEGHNARAAVNLLNMTAGYESRAFKDVNTDDDLVALPGFFYTYSLKERPFSVGVGYYLPYALAVEWPNDGPFRNATVRGELEYHTLSGIVAWQATETLSIAAGPTLNYSSTELRPGRLPGAANQLRFSGDDFAFGMTAGILWKPLERHAFGLSYRSQTTMNYDGESRLQSSPVPVQDATARVPFPQVIVAGYSFRPTSRWNLEVNVDWTDWDRVNTPVFRQGARNTPLPLRWESSWAVEAGATRYFDNGLHVSGGYVYLQDSVRDSSFTPLVPDQDMHVFSAGVGGKHDRLTWDLTYQFTHGIGRDVSGSVYGPNVSGHYTFVAHAFSVSVGWHF